MKKGSDEPDRFMVVVTRSGKVQLLRVCDLKVLATVSSSDKTKFVAVTYCAGKFCVYLCLFFCSYLLIFQIMSVFIQESFLFTFVN